MTGIDQTANELTAEDGLLFACKLDGNGSASTMNWADVEQWTPDDGPLWLHLDRNSPRVRTWLTDDSGLTEPTIGALLADETRPRVFRGQKGIVAILRGLNTNPGAEPEDLVAIRIWSDGQRLITLRHRRLMTARDVLTQLIEHRNGPRTISQLFDRLISRLVERMAETVASYDDKLDAIEANLDVSRAAKVRRELSDVRQDTIMLRRYLSPQREALNSLQIDPPQWLEDRCRMNLRETVDILLRYIESLDSARERSIIIKDDIANQLSESTNRTLYVLSIISAIFLPLGFLTGLLGINVGGMPGVDSPYAFWIASAIMLSIVALEYYLFRKLKWLG